MADKSSVGDKKPKEVAKIGIEEALSPLTRDMEIWVEKACDTNLPMHWRHESIYAVIKAAEAVKKEMSKHVE